MRKSNELKWWSSKQQREEENMKKEKIGKRKRTVK